MGRAVVALLAFLLGCGEPRLNVLVTACHSEADIALEFWSDRVDSVSYEHVAEGTRAGIGQIALIQGELRGATFGLYDRKRRTITVTGCRPQTIAHEVGHALGLGHRNEPGALMNSWSFPTYWGLTKSELEAVQ